MNGKISCCLLAAVFALGALPRPSQAATSLPQGKFTCLALLGASGGLDRIEFPTNDSDSTLTFHSASPNLGTKDYKFTNQTSKLTVLEQEMGIVLVEATKAGGASTSEARIAMKIFKAPDGTLLIEGFDHPYEEQSDKNETSVKLNFTFSCSPAKG